MRVKIAPDQVEKLKRNHAEAKVESLGNNEYIVIGVDWKVLELYGTVIPAPLNPPAPIQPVVAKSDADPMDELFNGLRAFESKIIASMSKKVAEAEAKFNQQLESFPKMLTEAKHDLQAIIDTNKAALEQQLQGLRNSVAQAQQQMEQATTNSLQQITAKTQETQTRLLEIEKQLETLAVFAQRIASLEKESDEQDAKSEKEAIAFATMAENIKKSVNDFLNTIGVDRNPISASNVCSLCGKTK